MANNYETHFYNGDKFKIRFTDDAVSLDLRDDAFRGKLYDKEYALGLSREIKNLFREKMGYELDIPANEISSEIIAHAGLYDFSEGLDEKATKASFGGLNLLPTIASWGTGVLRNKVSPRAEFADIGVNDADWQKDIFRGKLKDMIY